jgi:Voltage-dependent L-type calcium channel, IQ-associated
MKIAIIYMDSFILLVRLIFLNLFIAIILDSFGDVTDQEARLLNSDMVERILESWANFDSNATGFIKVTDFEAFMRELRRPIGWDKEDA